MQSTNKVLMIRPVAFDFNYQTAKSNHFQQKLEKDNQSQALVEFDNLVNLLIDNDIQVKVIQDTQKPHTPDSIFPNNWFSTTAGKLIYYPMANINRQQEFKPLPVEYLESLDRPVLDIRNMKALEGTGSIVFDHGTKIAFACLSPRTNQDTLDYLCSQIGYDAVVFEARDKDQNLIYHTNVMMSVGGDWAVVCMDSIDNKNKQLVKNKLQNKKIIDISLDQVYKFCGNILELESINSKKNIAMSKTAYCGFSEKQKEILSSFGKIIYTDIPTIETNGGGSVRCMLAEIF